MQWQDSGYILGYQKYGEHGAILQLFTEGHGRHPGLLRGYKKQNALIQPGNRLMADWVARLENQLGTYKVEQDQLYSPRFMRDAKAGAMLQSANSLLLKTLPEREPHPELFEVYQHFILSVAQGSNCLSHYIQFECELLTRLGFGLNLEVCTVTGRQERLTHVSPRTGAAVCAEVAKDYMDKLLPLPRFLQGNLYTTTPPSQAEVIDGLRLTGYFLEKWIFHPQSAYMPEPRGRLVELAMLREVQKMPEAHLARV